MPNDKTVVLNENQMKNKDLVEGFTSGGANVVKNAPTPKATHRYFCEACTGVAFYCDQSKNSDKAGEYPKTCHACGAPVVIKPQNFIKL